MRCPYLVGRDPELERLRAGVAAARTGHGGAVFVSGEPGVGKSRLVRELAETARRGDVTVLAGRAVPGAGETAYRPIAEALAQALRDRPPPGDPALAPWLPALRVMVPALDQGGEGSAETTVHTCGEALVQLLRSVRGAHPLLVLLEDLHWADPDTLGVVEYLADNLAGEPVVCVATLRTEPPTAAELARRVSQRGAATHLPLSRLNDEAVAEMVTACQPDAPGDLVTRVQAAAEGVPLLVEELLATRGVPASIGEAVRTRVAVLDQSQRAVLYAAAVLGRDFDWRLLPAITGQPEAQVATTLEQLVAAMLITVDGEEFRFWHALTREAVVASLVPPRRVALARAALAALDAAHPDHDRADLALQAGDAGRAHALLAASGQASLRRGALGTAIATLRRAVELPGGGAGTGTQAALVTALSLAGRLDEALAVGEELLTRLGSGGPDTAAVHLELARAAVAATRWPVAVTHLDAAKGVLAAKPDARLAARVRVLEAEVALAADDLDGAHQLAGQALAAAETVDAREVRCHALELIGRSHRVRDLDAARAAFDQAHRVADGAGLPVWRLRALHELGTIDLFDHAGTESLAAAREVADQLGVPSTGAVLDIQLTAAYHLRFDLDAAYAHARRAVALAGRLGQGRTHAVALFFEAGTAALAGDRDAMTEAVARTLRAAPDDAEIEGYVQGGAIGMLELLWGERVPALAALDRGLAALHGVASSSPGHYRGLWALLHAVGQADDAADRVAKVRDSGATVMRANRGYLAYAEAVLARSAATVTAGDGDLELFPVWHAIGRMLVAESALAGDWGQPEPWLRGARECFERYGLDRLARHCARLLGEAPRPAPAGVTAREAEVLELVVAGLANKQIAARLHLSVRTVEKHLESLLRKTGARSRGQLIAMRGMGETT